MATKNDIFSITELHLQERYLFRRNTVSFEIEIKEIQESEQVTNFWKPTNLNDLYVELQKAGILITEAKLKALLRSKWVQDYNPFLSYFVGLQEQDPNPELPGKKDYIWELAEFVKCGTLEEKFQFVEEFKKALIRCVACSLGQSFNKQCFVLVSPIQNIGKTSFIKFLCPKELEVYYTEEMSFDKDGLIALSSNFIINLDELSVIAKSDLNTLKTYFSKDSIKVRLPYEAKASTAKRLCNFFASTNNEDFLNDPTGSVRWVAFYIESIDFKYSQKVNIDNVWWQAYQMYLKGETGKLTKEDITENERRNTKFTKITSEMELIAKHCTIDEKQTFFYTVTEIQEKLATLSTTKVNSTNVGKALQSLGHKRISKRTEGRGFPVYGYYLRFPNDVADAF
jgi:predicted P-loop ATPase